MAKSDYRMMEPGAGPDWNLGASVRLWEEYFWRDDFRLHVVDLKPTAETLANERVAVTVGDLGDPELLRLAAARTVAGALGSALHLLMAFGESSGQRRLIALGGPLPNDSNPNVALQAARQGIPFRHVVCLEPDPLLRKRMRFMTSSACIAARLDALALDLRW